MIPDAHVPGRSAPPMMTTADLSLRFDPVYEPIARRFLGDPQAFGDAFAQAWFKLTHRDLGPRSCYLGCDVPEAVQSWQDPLPTPGHPTIDASAADALKRELLSAGLSHGELISTAWASASSFRQSDRRGGANGARLRLQPQCSWELNNPGQLKRVLNVLEAVKQRFNQQHQGGMQVSLADLIVLGGSAAVEQAMAAAGQNCHVRFTPGGWMPAPIKPTRPHSMPSNPSPMDFATTCAVIAIEGRTAAGGSRPAETERTGDDGPDRRIPGAGAELGWQRHRCAHQQAGPVQQRLLRQPAGHVNAMEPVEGHSNLYQGVDAETKQPRWRASRVDLVWAMHNCAPLLRCMAKQAAQPGWRLISAPPGAR